MEINQHERDCCTAIFIGALFIIVEKWKRPSVCHVNGQRKCTYESVKWPSNEQIPLKPWDLSLIPKTHHTRRESTPGRCPLTSIHVL